MRANAETLGYSLATAAALLSGKCWRDGFCSLPSVYSFESKDGEKLAPARIIDRFIQTRLLAGSIRQVRARFVRVWLGGRMGTQIFGLNGFKIDRIVLTDQRQRGLVMIVQALPPDFLMGTLQKPNSLAAALTSLLAARHSPLGTFQCLLCPAVVTRVLNRRTLCCHEKDFQAHVYACLLSSERQRLAGHICTGERGIPPISLLGNRNGLRRPFQGAGPAHRDMPNFGEQQDIANQTCSIAPLGVRKRVVAIMAFEAGVSCLLACLDAAKERFEGAIYPQDDILQDLGMNGRAIFSKLANVWQLGLLVKVAQRHLTHLPGIAAFLESGIVEFAADAQDGFQPRRLDRGWLQFVFECLEDACLWYVGLLLTRFVSGHDSVWPVQNRKRGAPFIPLEKSRGLLA